MRLGIALMAAASVTAGLCPVEAATTTKYDGSWSVEVVTRQGVCNTYKWRVEVGGGRITSVEDNMASALGGIDPHGRVAVTLTRGPAALSVHGALSEQSGAGNWVSQSLACSGDWRAERRQ